MLFIDNFPTMRYFSKTKVISIVVFESSSL